MYKYRQQKISAIFFLDAGEVGGGGGQFTVEMENPFRVNYPSASQCV